MWGWLYKDGLEPVAELDGSRRVVALFVYGERAHVPSVLVRIDPVSGRRKAYRVVTDHLGSVRLVVDGETGEVVQRIGYGPWGEVLEDTSPGFQPFGFAGGLYDPDTGLVRFGARDYDAEVGRWTAVDPILFAGGDTNLYGYVLNDPVNWIDPGGLVRTYRRWPGDLLGGGAGGGGVGPMGSGGGGVAARSCPYPKPPTPPADPRQPPGLGWEWLGPPDKGSWYNPKTRESLRPDLQHEPPIGPHWDYKAPDGQRYRLFPDGTVQPKKR